LTDLKKRDPEWVRIRDAATATGLSRTQIISFIQAKVVESRYVIRPGKKQGLTMIRLQQLRHYLESLPGTKLEALSAAAEGDD
jgi:hypothetical protein